MGFPQLLFGTGNNAHETFRETSRGDDSLLARAAISSCPRLPTAPRSASATVPHCRLAVNNRQRRRLLDPVPVFTRQQETLTGRETHGGVIYDGPLRSPERACQQTAILTRYRGLSSLALNKQRLSPSCAENKIK